MPETIFDKLMPTISQLGREKRAKKAKEKRTQRTIDIAQQLIHGDVSGETRAALYAEATQLGFNLPSAYAFDLLPDEKLPAAWSQELRNLYRTRGGSYLEIDRLHRKATGDKELTIDQAEILWNHNERLQSTFKGTNDVTGAQQFLAQVKAVQSLGASAATRFLGTGAPGQQTAAQYKSEQIEKLLGGASFSDLRADPVKLGKLDALGISYDDISNFYGYDVSTIAKAKNAILDRVKKGDIVLGIRLEDSLAKWRLGTLKDKSIAATLDKYFNKETGELKADVVLAEVASLEDLALRHAGLDEAVAEELPERLKPIMTGLHTRGIITKADLEAEIAAIKQALANPDPFRPLQWPNGWNMELLEEALEYFE